MLRLSGGPQDIYDSIAIQGRRDSTGENTLTLRLELTKKANAVYTILQKRVLDERWVSRDTCAAVVRSFTV